jgi:hypothetical protein
MDTLASKKARDFSFLQNNHTVQGLTKPSVKLVPVVVFLVVGLPGYEAENSLPSNAEMKNVWV